MPPPASLPQPFIPLNSHHATLETVGGKGLNLSRLVRAGFPVPDGFLIPTSAYQEYVRHNHLDSRIKAELQELGAASAGELTAASEKIRALFTADTILPELADALEGGWRWLDGDPVAVRSSATAEDLPELSFAGQQDTYLNVVGAEALQEAVVKCWSSLWTARAIGYRARNGIPHEEIALAVVVQKMVPSQSSGVLFTANPLNGLRSQVVIDATLGLGEALVSGQVEPDHYVVNPVEGTILQKALGSKSLVIRGKDGGGVVSREADASDRQALPDGAILQLAQMGKEIESLYGFPQDIEWAYLPEGEEQKTGKIYILQSRPITSLFPLPEDMPPEPLKVLVGLHTVQGILEPITPLGQDLLKSILTHAGDLFDLNYTLETQSAFFSAGERLWINTTAILRNPIGHRAAPEVIKFIDPGVSRAYKELVKDERLTPGKFRPRLKSIWRFAKFLIPIVYRVGKAYRSPDKQRQKVTRAFDDRVAAAQSSLKAHGELWVDYSNRVGLIRQIQDLFTDPVIPEGVPLVMAGMAPFFGILQRYAYQVAEVTGEEHYRTLHMEVARGLPNNVTTEMDLELWETAKRIQRDSTSAVLFGQATAEELSENYLTGSLPPQAQSAVADFLQRYGMRGLGEIDIGRPRWSEDPVHILQVLQSYLRIDNSGMAPDAVFERGGEAAQRAAALLEDQVRKLRFGRLKARLVRFAVSRYRAVAGMREAPKFVIIRIMGVLRHALLQSGEELVNAGMISECDDLFFLTIDELESSAADRQITPQMRDAIQQRRAVRQREMRRVQIPRVMLSDGRAFYEGVAAPAEDSEIILGDPVSPGVAEGPVRVVLDPQATQLEPGEILVCPGTDPAWTPLFLAAGGLVMEVGGMMTHGSVVAREYGIPAVVGVDQATKRLHTGQIIRVDGSTGEIEVIG